jgi:hypothetical protein
VNERAQRCGVFGETAAKTGSPSGTSESVSAMSDRPYPWLPSWLVVGLGEWLQARGSTGAVACQRRVDDADPTSGAGEEAQEVRGQGCAEAVQLLRADVRGGQGGGDDGVAGEGH